MISALGPAVPKTATDDVQSIQSEQISQEMSPFFISLGKCLSSLQFVAVESECTRFFYKEPTSRPSSKSRPQISKL